MTEFGSKASFLSSAEFKSMREEPSDRNLSVKRLAIAVYRNRQLVFWTMVLCWLGAFVTILITPKTYSATTQVLLEPLPRRPIAVATDGVADPLDSAQADSRMQVVKSERLLRSVFNTVGWVKVEETVNKGVKESVLSSTLKSVRSFFSPHQPSQETSDTKAFLRFMDSVTVRRIGLSYVIEITFQAQTPKLAAFMANSLTAAYLRNLVASSQMDGELLERRLSNVMIESQSLLEGVRTGIIPEGNFPDANARVISAAIAPLSHTSPKTGLIVMLATALGMAFGLFTSIVRFQRDRLIRSGADLRSATGLRQLAVFDYARSKSDSLADRIFVAWPDVFRQGSAQPLISQVLQDEGAGHHKAIGFVSCSKGAGSSSIALAATRAVSSSGSRATLVDADLHSPGLSSSFDLLGTKGLSDALSIESPRIDYGAASVDIGGIKFVSKGSDHSSCCLLGAPSLGHVLRRLREDGPVLVDLPAMERSLDADVIISHLDSVVIVVAANATTVDDVSATLRRLPRQKVVGFALNFPIAAARLDMFGDLNDGARRLVARTRVAPRLATSWYPAFRYLSKK